MKILGCFLLFLGLELVAAQDEDPFGRSSDGVAARDGTSPSTPGQATSTTTVAPEPKPVPAPAVEIGRWMLNGTGGDEGPCLLMEMGLEVFVDYPSTLANETDTGVFVVPSDASAFGICPSADDVYNGSLSLLDLEWRNPSAGLSVLRMIFLKNPTGEWRTMNASLSFIWDNGTFPFNPTPGENVTLVIEEPPFAAAANHSYKCSTADRIKLEMVNGSVNVTFIFTSVQIDAFRDPEIPPTVFNTPEVCALDRESFEMVAIAIGVSVAVLVIVLLVVFAFAWRRRAASRKSYSSV